ncbi:MAG: orotidine-5'-phosphate decarboxylase [Kofleriaceae bacterium]
MNPGNRLIVALDVASRVEVDSLLDRLAGVPSWVKVGLELFTSLGPSIVEHVAARGYSVMLDLKLHDIPETVARATASVSNLGAGLCTVHAAGGRAMLTAAAESARSMRVLAVTVLTSQDERDLEDIGARGPIETLVLRRATLATQAGCGGVVASPAEAASLRAVLPPDAWIVTPGVRPRGAALGDQKRVTTPAEARRSGADLIVVGRPIRDAADPAATAQAIIDELDLAAPTA